MSFHINAEDIQLEDGHILTAKLPNEDGDLVDATIDLNEHLGNSEGIHSHPTHPRKKSQANIDLSGQFEWEGVNFADSAEDIEFELEGDDGVPILRAKLANSEGELSDADVNLAERIANANGEFHFE